MSKLTLHHFTAGKEAIFPVESTLISGEKDAILVDAQFQKQYAQQLVEMIKTTGKNLTYIYISHSDPDYYFGLDTITQAFPNAKVISTAQTAYLIKSSKDEKMAVWGEQLKADAPQTIIVPEAVAGSSLELEGNTIEIKTDPTDPAHSYLWIPTLKTILGGISVITGSHLWMADTQGQDELVKWIKQLDSMKALQPTQVIASHGGHADTSPAIIDWVKTYLENYQNASKNHATTQQIVEKMQQHYPNLAGKDSLEMGAKVFTGEMAWQTLSAYPTIGRTAHVDFGNGTVEFDLAFKDHQHMTFTGTAGEFLGYTESIEYTAVEVTKNVFMVYWHEPKSGSNVVHVQNFNTNTVYTNIAGSDGSFTNLKGVITLK